MPPNEHPSAARLEPAIADEPSSPRRRRWLWVVAALAIAVVAAAGYWYWSGRPADAPAPAPVDRAGGPIPSARALPVVAVPARKGSIDVYLNALGTVTPRNIVIVKPRVDGQLMRVAFTEGQVVKAGALLAEIDPRPFQVQLAQAAGQMAKDQALLKNAQVDLERYRTLLSQDSISKQQVDTQEALVRQYQGTIEADQAAIDSAKLQLTYSRVTAPIGGTVGLAAGRSRQRRARIRRDGIVVIAQLQPISVIFPIPEDNLPRIRRRLATGEAIAVEAWDRDQKVKLATGKLLTIDNQIDTTTGTVKLKAEFANADLRALSRTSSSTSGCWSKPCPMRRSFPRRRSCAARPARSSTSSSADQTVTVAPVKLGPVQGETTAIISGVVPGDVVVTDGTDKLREGAKVELVTRDAQPASAPAAASKRGPRGDRPPGSGPPGGKQRDKSGG